LSFSFQENWRNWSDCSSKERDAGQKNPHYRSNLTFFGKNSKKNVKFYEKTVASFRIMWYSEGIENEEHERAQRN